MQKELEIAWEQFARLKELQLNPPATEEDIQKVEVELGFALPDGLRNLYLLADGQRDRQDLGVFKNVSGANVYSRVWFVAVDELSEYYDLLVSDQELKAEFGEDYLPFAVEGEEYLGYCYAISIKDGTIHILWTDFPDPFLPVEWQLNVIKRGENMLDFIQHQNSLLF